MNWFDEYIEDNLTIAGGGGETVPPVASASFPASVDYAVARDGAVSIPVIDASSSVALIAVSVRFAGQAHAEAVYLGGGLITGFQTGYSKFSAVAGSGAAGVGYTLTVRRDDSWPKGSPATFTVRAVDSKGNVLL